MTARIAAALGLLVLIGGAAPAAAQGRSIYSCTDASGKRLTADRPMSSCTGEQRELNADGSIKRIVPPTLTVEERERKEQCERDADTDRTTRNEAIRRELGLMKRYPNEDAHRKAREKALDDFRLSVKKSEQRVDLLLSERKPLLDEAEFYVGKQLPTKLKGLLDANDAALAAQRALIQNQQGEIVRINANYDEELDRLRKLWKGNTLASTKAPVVSCTTVGSAR